MHKSMVRFIAAAIMIIGNVAMWTTTGNTKHWLTACVVFMFGFGIAIGEAIVKKSY